MRTAFPFSTKDTTNSMYKRCFLFSGLSASFLTFLFFRVICTENALNNQAVDVLLQAFLICYAKAQEKILLVQLCNKFFWMWRTEFIVQWEPEKQIKNQFLQQKFENTSKFHLKFHSASDCEFLRFWRSHFELGNCLICEVLHITTQCFGSWKHYWVH